MLEMRCKIKDNQDNQLKNQMMVKKLKEKSCKLQWFRIKVVGVLEFNILAFDSANQAELSTYTPKITKMRVLIVSILL